jgi:radical SAM superfamily enzyme YgiQ (UPF0313 family)
MKIILLNTPQNNQAQITRDMAGGLGFDASNQVILPPLDLAIIAETLRLKKHHVSVIDPIIKNLSSEKIIKQINKFKPDLIIGTISLPSIESDIKFFKYLKKKTNAQIIAKTSITHPPILKKILNQSQIKYGLIGEVDLIIDQIISGKTTTGTFRLKDRKLEIKIPSQITDLDKLPLPARDLLKNKQYTYPLLGSNCTTMQTSRGCPFDCGYYCPYPLVQGKKWRAMSPKRVFLEIYDCVKNHQIDKILFRDATFTLNRQRIISICQKIIEEKLKISWWCETRVNCLNEELMKVMKKAGCQGMNVGVETGDPLTLKNQGKPGVSLEQLSKIKHYAEKNAIKLHFLLIIGLPQENRKSLLLTFQMIKKLKPDSLGVTIITPYPGTKLFDDAIKNKWIKTLEWDKYSGSDVIMETNNLKHWEMKLAQKAIIAEMIMLQKGLLGKISLFIEEIMFMLWAKI